MNVNEICIFEEDTVELYFDKIYGIESSWKDLICILECHFQNTCIKFDNIMH